MSIDEFMTVPEVRHKLVSQLGSLILVCGIVVIFLLLTLAISS